MAKKTTKKKAAGTGAKSKAVSAKPKKPAAKPAGKKAASKPVAKKKTVKKKPAPKPVSKKPAVKKKTVAAKGKAPAKKPASRKASLTPPAADLADKGKSDATATNTAPPPIRRVVRPTPPPPAEPAIEDWTPLSDAKLRKVKTDLSRAELNYFKKLLLDKRAEIIGDVMNMEESRSSGNGGELSNMPLHMADIGSDNYEQEFTLGLVESERKLLMEIDAALMRIKNRTYGVCIITGTPIPKARLEIKPWAKFGIEIVREREKRGLHSF